MRKFVFSVQQKQLYPNAVAYAALAVGTWFYEHDLPQIGSHFIEAGESALEQFSQGVPLVE